ncbi:MAG: hypothetical protein AB1724_12105 [Thermodesulfobacteriota bacterium]
MAASLGVSLGVPVGDVLAEETTTNTPPVYSSPYNTSDQGKIEAVQGKFKSTQGKLQSSQGKIESVQGKVTSTQGKIESVQGKHLDSPESMDPSLTGTETAPR